VYRESIIELLESASPSMIEEGKGWYREARDYCVEISKRTKIKLDIVVGVLAILSPRNRWERNKIDTLNLIKGYREKDIDRYKICTYNRNKYKALKLLRNKDIRIISGNKVKAFYLNILYPERSTLVTIDTWICKGLRINKLTPVIYKRVESEYYEVSKNIRDLLSHQIQAINWINIRGQEENKKRI